MLVTAKPYEKSAGPLLVPLFSCSSFAFSCGPGSGFCSSLLEEEELESDEVSESEELELESESELWEEEGESSPSVLVLVFSLSRGLSSAFLFEPEVVVWAFSSPPLPGLNPLGGPTAFSLEPVVVERVALSFSLCAASRSKVVSAVSSVDACLGSLEEEFDDDEFDDDELDELDPEEEDESSSEREEDGETIVCWWIFRAAGCCLFRFLPARFLRRLPLVLAVGFLNWLFAATLSPSMQGKGRPTALAECYGTGREKSRSFFTLVAPSMGGKENISNRATLPVSPVWSR